MINLSLQEIEEQSQKYEKDILKSISEDGVVPDVNSLILLWTAIKVAYVLGADKEQLLETLAIMVKVIFDDDVVSL